MTGTLTAFVCLGLTLGLRNLAAALVLPKPAIRAEPGSVVAKGSQVTILCEATSGVQDYYLYHGNLDSVHTMTPIKPGNKAKFLIPLIQRSHAGRYLCFCYKPPSWLETSDTLELVVTGYFSKKPTLSALTSLLVTSGENMTLQCVSRERYDSFILSKENETFSRPQDSQHINSTGKFQALFHIGPVTVSHRGTVRCYGYKNSTYVWSKPSDPLEIYITGQVLVTPTLSVSPDHKVSSGANVILLCQSWHQMDSFLLSKEGPAHSLQHLRSVWQAGLYQAKFIKNNVTFTDRGIYKCYGSQDSLPYLLSHPSNHVKLVVSESSEDLNFSSQEPIPTSALERYLKVLFGISVAFLLLLFLLTLLLLQMKRQDKRRKKAAAIHEENLCERKKTLGREMYKVSVHRDTEEVLVSKL
ncbi:leukocyte immunoglobulin-like receptor subfamily B member 3A isoform X1 [Peromyscus leucopus]|uniref:leukocyte immunoglobulin-like receptor subfamily B member 3A isoform X1 n=1 Tax=Peromyscus leucopus TaxID=10041 RepID=UPI001884B69B|nr:leukocyte immunoglobulin-like receptor subfamily B member 3A isoform X1 [Peromyscus leucopus]